MARRFALQNFMAFAPDALTSVGGYPNDDYRGGQLFGSIDRAKMTQDFVAAAQALDRALMAGRYVIPLWYADRSRIAHDARLRFPDRLPVYGDWIGFQPDVWWFEEKTP